MALVLPPGGRYINPYPKGTPNLYGPKPFGQGVTTSPSTRIPVYPGQRPRPVPVPRPTQGGRIPPGAGRVAPGAVQVGTTPDGYPVYRNPDTGQLWKDAQARVQGTTNPILEMLKRRQEQEEGRTRGVAEATATGMDKAYAAAREPLQGVYNSAIGQATAIEEAVSKRLQGEGAEAGQDFAAKLAAMGAPTQAQSSAQLATDYKGANAAEYAKGMGDVGSLVSRGAEARAYLEKQPALARQGVMSDMAKGLRELSERYGGQRSEIAASIPGQIQAMFDNLKGEATTTAEKEYERATGLHGTKEEKARYDADVVKDRNRYNAETFEKKQGTKIERSRYVAKTREEQKRYNEAIAKQNADRKAAAKAAATKAAQDKLNSIITERLANKEIMSKIEYDKWLVGSKKEENALNRQTKIDLAKITQQGANARAEYGGKVTERGQDITAEGRAAAAEAKKEAARIAAKAKADAAKGKGKPGTKKDSWMTPGSAKRDKVTQGAWRSVVSDEGGWSGDVLRRLQEFPNSADAIVNTAINSALRAAGIPPNHPSATVIRKSIRQKLGGRTWKTGDGTVLAFDPVAS